MILISKDEDFADMVLQTPTATLIWVRVGNCRKNVPVQSVSAGVASSS